MIDTKKEKVRRMRMKRILSEELKRSFLNKGMLVTLMIGGSISISQIIQYQIPGYLKNQAGFYNQYPILTPNTVSSVWIGGTSISVETFLYFFVLPILAMMPFGLSFFNDKESGYLKGIYMRTSRRKYLVAKYVSTFIAGGTAIVIPLLMNLSCALILCPNLTISAVFPQIGVDAGCVGYKLCYSKPITYIMLILAVDFIFGGIWACVALAGSFLSDYKIVVAVFPFFIQLILHVICTIFGKIDYSTVYLLQAGWGVKNIWVLIGYVVLGIIITFSIFMKKGEKENIF